MSEYISKYTGAEIDLRLEEAEKISPHVADTENPHGTTKSHVGLGSADNTSDANKPISTATQTALNGKVNNTGNESIAGIKNFTDKMMVKSFAIQDNGNAGEIIGGTAEDKLSFLSGDLKFNGDLVWTEGNDGHASGLDADTLDGAHSGAFVKKAGDETITGTKTFSVSPIVPAPTTDTQASSKKYVDDADALKVNIADIVNDLTTGGAVVPLSAEQGKTLKGEVGTLASLTTTEKGSLVGAVNEVDSHSDTNATAIGTLASLTTTEKTNLVGAINELNADKIETAAIANTLTETAEGKVLDARQGKVLADLVSTISPYVGDGTIVKDLTFNNDWKSGTPTIDPVTGVITLAGHGFSDNDAIEFGSGTGVLPTGITAYNSVNGWNTYYNVINVNGGTFQITNVILGSTPVIPSDAGTSGWQIRSGQLNDISVQGLDLSTDIAYEITCVLPFVRRAYNNFSEILFRPYDGNYTYLTGGFINQKFPRYQSFTLCEGLSSLANTSKHVMCVAKVKVTKVGTKIFYDIASTLNVSKEDIDTKTTNRVFSKNVAITVEDVDKFTKFLVGTSWTTAYLSGNNSRIIVRKVSV